MVYYNPQDLSKQELLSHLNKANHLSYLFRKAMRACQKDYVEREHALLEANRKLTENNEAVNSRIDELRRKEDELITANQVLTAREEKLKLLNEEVSQVARMKSEFLANMSHELRTPLNSILGFSELLMDSSFGELNEKQRKFLSNILSSGQHLLDLINDILDLSKIEAGKISVCVERTLLSDILAPVIDSLSAQAQRKCITLNIRNDEDIQELEVDIMRFKQILFNVIGNAIKFTPESGSVTVTIESHSTETGEEYVKFTITDTGIGISKEDYPKVFAEFEQVSETEGTGLGLALTKKLVECHGGEIWFSSEFGVGTSFFITIPLASQLVRKQEEWKEFTTFAPSVNLHENETGSLKTAYVCETDDNAKALMSLVLSAEGFSVDFFDSLGSLTAAVEKRRPAVICIDTANTSSPSVSPNKVREGILAHVPKLLIANTQEQSALYQDTCTEAVCLPLDKEKLRSGIRALARKCKPIDSKKELVVIDDDAHVIELVSRFFDGLNVSVRGFTDPEEGLAYLVNDPDIVILDIIMPGMNGFEVLKRIENAHYQMSNIVVFSLKELTDEEKRFLNRRVVKVIDKTNFSRETFVFEVTKLLAEKS